MSKVHREKVMNDPEVVIRGPINCISQISSRFAATRSSEISEVQHTVRLHECTTRVIDVVFVNAIYVDMSFRASEMSAASFTWRSVLL